MTLIDGKRLATNLNEATRLQITGLKTPPRLAVLACAPNFETRSYLELKKRKAEELGVEVVVSVLGPDTTTEMVKAEIEKACECNDGVVVQLPLPETIDTDAVLNHLPKTHDVDNFTYQGEKNYILPPVVGAIDYISAEYNVNWEEKKVVVIGGGRLVGAPAGLYARGQGSNVSILTVETTPEALKEQTMEADIIVLGAGAPGLLTSDMVKEGVVVFDAGTSEAGGILVGDAEPSVATKASIFTPVPGGIGPLTVAVLFSNLVDLAGRQ
jgi:methylenetetrahydrofolate dehydrogenase (NADP+) / methenyltetrahydrofolate cyclohydrolase